MPSTIESTPSHASPPLSPVGSTGYLTNKSVNLKDDDRMFMNIATALLERHMMKASNTYDVVHSILLSHERVAFWEAVIFRKAHLPMFPVANEDPCNQIVRDVYEVFGNVFQNDKNTSKSPRSPSKFAFNSVSPNDQPHSVIGALSSPHDFFTTSQLSRVGQSPNHLPEFHPSSPPYNSPHDVTSVLQTPLSGALYLENQQSSHVGMPQYRPEYARSPQDQFPSIPDSISPVLSPTQHRENSSAFNQSPTSAHGSAMSVETQPIQNLTSGEPQNIKPYRKSQHQHPSHPMETYTTTSPEMGLSCPSSTFHHVPARYKLFRPPALVIQEPSVVSVTSPPAQIDIDWNIPIRTTNEGIPSETSVGKGKIDLRTAQSVEMTSAYCVKSPDREPAPSTSVIVSATETPVESTRDLLNENKAESTRNKYSSVFDEAKLTHQSLEVRKSLLEEITRVSKMLSRADEEQMPGHLVQAYEMYRIDLLADIEKWNRVSSESGTAYDSRQRSDEAPAQDVETSAQNGKLPWSFFKTITSSKEVCNNESESRREIDQGEPDGLTNVDSKENKAKDRNNRFWSTRVHPRMINVVAPSTLPGGYQFEARNGDEHFVATVPPGGVTKGEIFATRMTDAHGSVSDAPYRTRVFRDMDVPPYRWRDELFDCFRHGVFHDFLLNSVFCPHVALSQIMARIQLSDTGDPVTTIKSRTNVCSYVMMSLFIIALHVASLSFVVFDKPEEDIVILIVFPLVGLDFIALLYFLYMVGQVRRTIRRKYGIPEIRFHGHEDCCLAVFCNCCTIAQMGRHTADYETYQSYCCTDTGLANHVEVKLPSDLADIEQHCNDNSSYRLI